MNRRLWRLVGSLFAGGTEQIKSLKGRKVRTRVALQSVNVYDPIDGKTQTIDLNAMTVGFVANPHPTQDAVLIAFADNRASQLTSLDDLLKQGGFNVVSVNKLTFKEQFEIED